MSSLAIGVEQPTPNNAVARQAASTHASQSGQSRFARLKLWGDSFMANEQNQGYAVAALSAAHAATVTWGFALVRPVSFKPCDEVFFRQTCIAFGVVISIACVTWMEPRIARWYEVGSSHGFTLATNLGMTREAARAGAMLAGAAFIGANVGFEAGSWANALFQA